MPRSNRPRGNRSRGNRSRSGESAFGGSASGGSASGGSASGGSASGGSASGGRASSRRGRRAPAGEPLDVGRATSGAWRTETYRDATWVVRPVSGPRAVKDYRCPGCDQEIRAGVPHVVVWPFDGIVGLGDGVTDRRHWHTPCWTARERRGGRR